MASKLKGIFHRKHAVPSAERQKIQKELFAFNKTVEHGFPHKPSALAYDPKLQLLALGTQNGVIKIYGAPGVELIGVHDGESAVWQLFFLPEQGRIISLLQDNSLHLWEVNIRDGNSVLEEVKSFSLEGRLKRISVCCLSSDCKILYLGTEGGNIYLLNVVTFDMDDLTIYQDSVMENVPDDYKVNPGSVEAIAQRPTSNEFLIGYNRGLIVVWNPEKLRAEKTFVGNQQLESLCWHRDGLHFTSAHNEGSYCIWNVNDMSGPEKQPVIPYGPFPCKAINKLKYLTTKSDPFLVFAGGMPRASYGDRHCVTVMQGNKHVVFDFTSKVIDFFTMSDVDSVYEFDEPHTLVVLVEEEIVFIDLQSESWPVFNLPYLSSLHASAITCQQHVSNLPSELWDKITAAGEQQMASSTTQREWPMNGGKNLSESTNPHDLLMTGHEDGTVRFWDASTVSMKFLYKLSTAQAFVMETDHAETGTGETEEWPPFRKVGNFDPFTDDPRLGVQKITLCSLSGTLLVGGTAGQVIVLNIGTEEVEKTVESFPIQIVGEQDKFVWKGHESLAIKEDTLKFAAGFQPSMILQAQPPASITALALQSSWGLTTLGTSHGFALFDNIQRKLTTTHCTLNPNDLSSTGQPMTRKLSMAKSLRASLRRMRKRRQRSAASGSPKKEAAAGAASGSGEPVQTTDIDADKEGKEDSGSKSSPTRETAQVERKIEARTDDTKTSIVRYLYFANTFVRDSQVATPSLWCGTNSGTIYIYVIGVPATDNRKEDAVTAVITKEIRLKHGAPVVSLVIVDSDTYPLPDPIDVLGERAKPPNMSGHSLIVCSEEQFKVFHLPSLKPTRKTKLTAQDGSKVRKVSYINFRSRSDDNYLENCVSCMTNLGELAIYSIPGLKKQLGFSAIRKENVSGIQSLIFTSRGEGFYLLSPSELERFSLSARYFTEPMCMLELPEGMRPAPPEPEPEEETAPEEVAETPIPVDGHPIAEETPAPEEAPVVEAEPPATEPAVADEAPAVVEAMETVVVEEPADDDPMSGMKMQSSTVTSTVTTSSTRVIKTERTVISSSGDGTTVQTIEVTSSGDNQTAEELHDEVSELLAKIPNINVEADTEENPDITLDEVREYGKDDQES